MVDVETHSSQFAGLAVATNELVAALTELEREASLLKPKPLAGREWYELLRQKLVPQFGTDAFLVVAVVGGTNIGKSVVFNHLAGCRASASSPLASGTKHPVCLVPRSFQQRHTLAKVFPDFQLQQWDSDVAALQECERHQLFWRLAPELPPNLLVLDTPDIDSDARVNWIRADAVRRSADVLIAVLTQQKYNDAAVKEFFRKAAAEDKAVIVVFNQCLMPDDEQYWPVWLETFVAETGIQPEAVYLAPADRRAADELRLAFYLREWPALSGKIGDSATTDTKSARNLSEDLARLRFEQIRARTLTGSMREVLNPQRGAPAYLVELRDASEDLAGTAKRLTSDSVVTIRNWPSPDSTALVAHVRTWWKTRQHGWAKRVNGVYNAVGAGIAWPFRMARNAIAGEPVPAMTEYRHREWEAVLTTVEELYDRLEWMAESGNDVIQPRIERALAGSSRQHLLALLRERHADVDFDDELALVVDKELQQFSTDSPEMFKLYNQLNHVSAVVRPVTSVVLFSVGFGPAGEVVAPFVADAAAQAVVHVVADVTGGATVAVAGEAAVSGAAGKGAGLLQAWFHRLHSAFTARRAEWLTVLIHKEVLGTLPEDLRSATQLPASPEFLAVQRAVSQLNELTQTQSGR
jgi:50S ribosome-binding GTPase